MSKNKPKILIVDDEKNTREGLARALRRNYDVALAENGEAALAILDSGPVDVVLSDIRMPGMDGIALLEQALVHSPQPVCILLTAYGSIETAVEAMKRGAYDFLSKPVNLDRLDIVLQRALSARDMETENQRLKKELDTRFGMENIIGVSPVMQEVFETIRQIAASRATVLIEGESGTGKELVAHAIHRLSSRVNGQFVAVHCAALSPALLESELFGHEKGAFTGAHEQRVGRFERADGGTLFLDEIGEIAPEIQVKILRVLETRSFERVGGAELVQVDTRLISATNRDLKQMMEDGDFREDLFYRLHVVVVKMPPLRSRGQDIPLLADHFLQQLREENLKDIEGFTPDAMATLSAYRWPGNVRELRNVIERMVVLSRGGKLTVRDIPAVVRDAVDPDRAVRPQAAVTLELAEKQMIAQALKAHGGNRTKAAEQLGISRRTLHRKLNEYGLRKDDPHE